MKIAIGSDHAGFELKENLKKLLKEKGYECHDLGAESFDHQDDYPVYGRKVAEAVASGEYDRGIIMCGTGMGIAISANKVPGVRAAVAHLQQAPVDLVVTDVVMPDGGGAALIAWLDQNRPGVPVVICSCYSHDETVRRGVQAEEYPFVQKPFQGHELLEVVQRALGSG